MTADEAYAKAVDAWRDRDGDAYQDALSALWLMAKKHSGGPVAGSYGRREKAA